MYDFELHLKNGMIFSGPFHSMENILDIIRFYEGNYSCYFIKFEDLEV